MDIPPRKWTGRLRQELTWLLLAVPALTMLSLPTFVVLILLSSRLVKDALNPKESVLFMYSVKSPPHRSGYASRDRVINS
jgi:hypothetical protein